MRIFLASALAIASTLESPQTRAPIVTVDREVHVSASDAALKIGETVLAAHPTDPNRLVGAGMVSLNGAGRRAVVVYTSRDGGVSWARTLSTADAFYDASDEALAFARDGTVYLVLMVKDRNWGRMDVVLYRSDDGGSMWTLVNRMATSTAFDRPFVSVRKDGLLYVMALGAMRRSDDKSVSGPAIFTSADRGRSLTFIGIQAFVPPGQQYFSGNIVLTSKGVAVVTVPEMDDGAVLNTSHLEWGSYRYPSTVIGSIKTMRVTPTVTLDPLVAAGRAWHPLRPGQFGAPILAVDASGRLYNDRLYLVWVDRRAGHARIMSAFSTDEARSWSTTRAVDDVPGPTAPQSAPNNIMPMVAVNRDGVVGSIWYDRRDDPANLSWRVRFAASFDGGETWRPSVVVSSQENSFDADGMFGTTAYGSVLELNIDDRQLYAGDTVGFAAAADGSFHAFWIDNRTGVPQIWAARVRVAGRATRNGAAELEELTDVSADTQVVFDHASYRGGLVQAAITITNTSERTLTSPATLRVVVAESAIGVPELLNADNGELGAGALWDIAPYFPNGRLEPGATSKPLAISCRLRSRKPIADGVLLRAGLLRLEAKVLALVSERQK